MATSTGARVLDVWMDGRHVHLRQPVITDWASTAPGRGAVTGRVVTPMPGRVTKVCPHRCQNDDILYTRSGSHSCAFCVGDHWSVAADRCRCPHRIRWLCCPQVFAQDGDKIAEGDAILELSSMKLFYAIEAPCSGVLSGLRVAPGDQVGSGEVLCNVVAEADGTAPATAA